MGQDLPFQKKIASDKYKIWRQRDWWNS